MRIAFRSSLRWSTLALLPLVVGGSAPATPTGTSCERLVALTLPQVKITFAAETPAGPFTPPRAPPSFTPLTVPAFCRVVAVSTPTIDSTIDFEVWIPMKE